MPGIHVSEIILLLLTVFWLWMLIDCIFNKSLQGTQKILWFLLILFTYILGAILYFGTILYSFVKRLTKKAP